VLNGCPVACQQGILIIMVLYYHICMMAELQACPDNVEIFAKCASDLPPVTTPPAILVCRYWPDIVVYNAKLRTISHCWDLLARLILMLTFLLHISIKKVNLNTNEIIVAWAL